MTTYNTGNPIGSTEVKDLYDNAQNFDTLSTTTTLETVPDRLGVPRMTFHGFEKEANRRFEFIKFQPPIPYAPGIEVTTSSLTVDYLGVIYYALPSALPFTTGAWNPAQWSPVQNTYPGNELLVFDDYAAASAAAATLPDGQQVEIESDETRGGRSTRNVVQDGGVVFKGLASDSESTSFVLTEIGAAARTAFQKLSEILSIKDFGAVADGASHPLSEFFSTLEVAQLKYPHAQSLTDEVDWAATISAINAAGLRPTGCAVHAPAGVYLMSGPVQQPFNAVSIYGDGQGSTVFRRAGDWSDPVFGNNLFVFAAGSFIVEDGNVVNNVSRKYGGLQRMTVESTSKMLTVGALIYSLNSEDLLLEDLELRNGFQALHLRGIVNSTVNNVRIVADHAVMDDTRFGETTAVVLSFSRGTFKNNTVRLNQIFVQQRPFPADHNKGYATNLQIESADGVWITDCYFGGAAERNIRINPRVSAATSEAGKAALAVTGIKINSCWLDYARGLEIVSTNGLTTSIRNVRVSGTTMYLLNGYGNYGVLADTEYLDTLKIDDSHVSDAGFAAVRVTKGKNILIGKLTTKNLNRSGTAQVGCVEINPAGVDGAVDGVSITNSCVLNGGTTAYGVIIGAGTRNYNVSNNDLRGNTTRGAAINATTASAESGDVYKNVGYRTNSSGFVVFNPSETSKEVAHKLDKAPIAGDINLSINSAAGAAMGQLWISNITATTFTINTATAPATASTVRWKVDGCTFVEV